MLAFLFWEMATTTNSRMNNLLELIKLANTGLALYNESENWREAIV